MIDAISQRWNRSNWFKLTVFLIIGLIITGIIFQSVVGINPATGGTSILGDRETIQQLDAGKVAIYSIELPTELNVLAFTSNPETQVFVIYELLNSSATISYLAEHAEVNETTDELSIWIEKQTFVSLVVVAPSDNDIQYRFEIRSFDPDNRSGLVYHAIGGFMYTFAILVVIIYLIFGELLPWMLSRGNSSNEIHQEDL